MKICKDCKHWDKEFMACILGPYEIEEVECLLKNILAVLLNQAEDTGEGDSWKQ